MAIVKVLHNHEGQKCMAKVKFADHGPAHCNRHGRVLIDGEPHCLQHAGALAIQAAIKRGSL